MQPHEELKSMRFSQIPGFLVADALRVFCEGVAFYVALLLCSLSIANWRTLPLPFVPRPPLTVTFLPNLPNVSPLTSATADKERSRNKETSSQSRQSEGNITSSESAINAKPSGPIQPADSLSFPISELDGLRREGAQISEKLRSVPAIFLHDPQDLWFDLVRSQLGRKLGFLKPGSKCSDIAVTLDIRTEEFATVKPLDSTGWCSEVRHPESEAALSSILPRAAEFLRIDSADVRVVVLWEKSDLLAFLAMIVREAQSRRVDPSLITAAHIALLKEPYLAFRVQEFETDQTR